MSAPVRCCPFSSHQVPNFSLRTCWLWQYMHPLAWYTLRPAAPWPASGCGYGSSAASFWYAGSSRSCQNGKTTSPSQLDASVRSDPTKITIPRSISGPQEKRAADERRKTQIQKKKEWPQKSTRGTREGRRGKLKTEFKTLLLCSFCAPCAFLRPLF